ncbi:hypothetical protein [Novosphingobium sp. NDB2Meth1]|uniref:hypothetical protein n=1 Tax=Novosphingobium sp. NDB2Meth1 TaxID=1892847 RepID=UPI00209A9294|nr:hypothetical protein [Novosphingobium sp. NDB2Meth1]
MASRPPSHDANRTGARPAASQMAVKWTAVHEAAAAIGELAGIAPEYRSPEVRNFPAIMRDTGGWRMRLAEQGVDDLAAILEPGLAALLALHGSGAPAGAAALALWQEFHTARAGLLALIPPLGIER